MSLDLLKIGKDIISGSKEASPVAGAMPSGNLLDTIKGLFSKKNPEAVQNAIETSQNAKAERGGLFQEAGRSLLLRQFPRLMLAWDVYKAGEEAKNIFYGQEVKDQEGKIIRVKKPIDQETLQKGLMGISALLIIVPGEWKHSITDLFADSSIFQALVKYWPGLDGIDLPYIEKYLDVKIPLIGLKGGNLRERILNEKEPNAIMLAMRIMAQDLFTGKVTFDSIKGLLGGSNLGAAAALAAGGGALALGAKALGGESPGGALGGLAEALGGKPKGKKLLELVKAHPEQMPTDMQKNLLALLKEMKVAESAELIKGDWADNNDYCTVSYIFDNGIYYLEFDNDISGTDLKINNANGQTIADFSDWSTFNASDDAQKIIAAMKTSPSPALNAPAAPATTPVVPPASASLPTNTPANDNATAGGDKKTA